VGWFGNRLAPVICPRSSPYPLGAPGLCSNPGLLSGPGEVEVCCFGGDVSHLFDEASHPTVVGDPHAVELGFSGGESAGHGLAIDFAGPLPVGPVGSTTKRSAATPRKRLDVPVERVFDSATAPPRPRT